MFENSLILPTRRKLEAIQKLPLIQQFYLAGGSGLALHFGHRRSEDLDFFTAQSFSAIPILKGLQKVASFKVTDRSEDTLSGVWEDTKISFMKYPYSLMGKTHLVGKVRIASIEDIALMKLDAVSARGTKRDFIDLYWISKYSNKTLLDYVRLTKRKFGKDYSIEHLIKSLSYFVDADREPMPILLKKLIWEEVKSYFIFQSAVLAKKFILNA